MHKLLIAVGTTLCVATVSLAPASASAETQPERHGSARTVKIVGDQKFSPDEFFTITYRFRPRLMVVHRGDSITWTNGTDDGHTVSVVAPADIPRTVADVNNCSICNTVLAAHFPNGFPPQGAPVLLLDDLKPTSAPERFDSPGDSMVIAPPGQGFPTSASAAITARPGTTLNYLCAIHAWMQGQIRVVGARDDDDG